MAEGGRPERVKPLSFPHCDEVSKYERLTKVGQGTFGEVWKARERPGPGATGKPRVVALKKVLMDNEKEGFPVTALREIKILQKLHNDNIVRLIEICRGKPTPYAKGNFIYLVFEFCEHDLAGLLSNPNVKFSLGEIKTVMQQLLNSLFFLHHNRILHRDMKAANILITKTGVLKLADFGLARAFSSNKDHQRYTSRVVTLWYRPPELLLGDRDYGPPIDVWGVGCIMAEMWTRAPILQGRTEQNQIELISHLCGSINEQSFPACVKLPLYQKVVLQQDCKRKVRERLRTYVRDSCALELIDKLLNLNPAARVGAGEALDHDFFWSDPEPASLEVMLRQHQTSNFEFLAPRRTGAVMPPGRGQGTTGSNNSTMQPRDYTSATYDHVF